MNEYEIDDISLHNENFFNFWLLKCAVCFRTHNDTVIFGYLRQSLQNVNTNFFLLIKIFSVLISINDLPIDQIFDHSEASLVDCVRSMVSQLLCKQQQQKYFNFRIISDE